MLNNPSSWWVHLANHSVRGLALVQNDTASVLMAWIRHDTIALFDLHTGASQGTLTIEKKTGQTWGQFLSDLALNNPIIPPIIQHDQETLFISADQKSHLHQSHFQQLRFFDGELAREIFARSADQLIHKVAFEPIEKITALLDTNGYLHIFRRDQFVRKTPVTISQDLGITPPQIAMTQGGDVIYISDGNSILRLDALTQKQTRLHVDFSIRQMTCSPDGRYLVVNDSDHGVIRVYTGDTLTPSYQRFAIDLVAQSKQVQLLADLPPVFVAPTTLACNNAGTVAFSMAGVICVSHITFMDNLPRARQTL
jgi:WD40 repeat protein